MGSEAPGEVRTDDGVRLWARVSGDQGPGPPVVFCHGGPGLWDTLQEPARLLREHAGSVRVHRWDQRGCGRSGGGGPYTVARSVADLHAVRGHFHLARMALVGHSWGALLALRYALAHPDRVSGLVYVSGTGVDPDETWFDTFLANFRQRLGPDRARYEELAAKGPRWTTAEAREWAVLQWTTDFVDPDRERARAHAEAMATPWFGVNVEANRELRDEVGAELRTGRLPFACRGLDVPTLIVDGAQDPRPRAAVDSLARALPRVRRVVLPGAGHLPWAEDPAGFQSAVGDFLAGLD